MTTDVRLDRVAETNEALARSMVYRLLSQAFAYPTPVGVERLLHEDLPLAEAVSASLPAGVPGAFDRVVEALTAATVQALETAYRAVFSHVHSADCPMYETDYTVRDVWKQTRELADLGGFYRAFGLEEQGERQDNVCVELEFLHVLAYKQAWAMAQGKRRHEETCRITQETFLRDHVLRWVPDFVRRVEALAGSGPYAAVAALASAFLMEEAARFGLERVSSTVPGRLPDEEAAEEIGLCEGAP